MIFFKHIPLYLEICCGSAFDGAAVMSGCLTGVSTRLKELVPYALTRDNPLLVTQTLSRCSK